MAISPAARKAVLTLAPPALGITNAVQGTSSSVTFQIGSHVYTSAKPFPLHKLPPEVREEIILMALEGSKEYVLSISISHIQTTDNSPALQTDPTIHPRLPPLRPRANGNPHPPSATRPEIPTLPLDPRGMARHEWVPRQYVEMADGRSGMAGRM